MKHTPLLKSILLITVMCLVCAQSIPASASLFCYVKQSPDGFVALRKAPRVTASIVGRMKVGDEVQIGLGRSGNWIEVFWWHADDRLTKGFDKKAGRGWVNRRLIESDCG